MKEGLQKYCDQAYSTTGVNQMWLLKNSKELLQCLDDHSLKVCTSIKTFDFSTLYTTIPHSKLKERLKLLISQCFFYSNGSRRYKYLVLGREKSYFVKHHTGSDNKYTDSEIIQMLEFLIDNIFVEFGGQIFQQSVGIPMGTNCAPLLADLFLYSYEAEFIENLLKDKKNKRVAKSFNFTFRYIDDVLSINNPKFGEYLQHIYPSELQIKETTDTARSASYLDIHLTIDDNGLLQSKIYDKRDDFNFPIVNFPFLSSNIPTAPAYGVYVSQLIRYARACSGYNDFLDRSRLLTEKLLRQGFENHRLQSYLRKFYGRHHELVDRYNISVSQLSEDLFSVTDQTTKSSLP